MPQHAARRYLVGIDLGTTHTVVAYADTQADDPGAAIAIFDIEQLVAAGEVARLPLLPSFRYHPAPEELATVDCRLPWSESGASLEGDHERLIVGDWARTLGAKSEGRLVASAKSWLSHGQVDRRAGILPWGAGEEVSKVSPLNASASYLAHVRAAWNREFPDDLLERQQIVITVPASFNEDARALTLAAAKLAGLPDVRLLEEPQAVCYDWYARQGDQVSETLAQTQLLMVCDVGGGTTDLSLIRIDRDAAGALQLSRIGVGDHLMLGGDNIDLALARLAEQRLNLGQPLKNAQLSQLVQQARQAKERLLADDAPDSATVTLVGGGSRLIGGAKRCELRQADIDELVLEGFLPITDLSAMPQKRRSAVVDFGLPYASDAAISRHLAAFLQAHQPGAREALGTEGVALPDALLLNGGVFRSPRLSQRVTQLLGNWRGDDALQLLDNPHPDLAVARGAVAYGVARSGGQPRIGGGSARTYFLAIDGEDDSKQAVCLLPRGTEEGVEVELADREFQLMLDQPVQFSLYTSTQDQHWEAGALVAVDDQFTLLPPLIAALPPGTQISSSDKRVKVGLVTQLTEVGTLQLDCLSRQSELAGQRWQVEFELRRNPQQNLTSHVALPPKWEQAKAEVELIFGSSKQKVDPKRVKSLRNVLEKLLGKRADWDISLLRALADVLLEGRERRHRSQAHERVWLNLAGFCLRPGFGDPADDWRIEQVWPLFNAGLHYDREVQSWIDWWTFWRRLSGGLTGDRQQQIYAAIAAYIDPANLRSRKLQAEVKVRSYEDIVRLAGTLERLPAEDKKSLGGHLLTRLEKSSETLTSWWALGRIGSRVPFYGSGHAIVDADTAANWLQTLMRRNWSNSREVAFAAVMIARLSSDRSSNIGDALRSDICERLQVIKAPEGWLTMLQDVQALDEQSTRQIFGEALPQGLQLLQ